ncbi:MAG: hypothetical protein HKO65_20395, partial [Gemmatimonadetes bacterium]|nr:hypothetical protein [Gemmatimonadota bacterium]
MPTQSKDGTSVGHESMTTSRKRTALILFEVFLVLVLLLYFLFFENIRDPSNLFVLFLYSFPSEFLVGLIPHEPALIYYGEAFDPLVVALVSVVSTVMAEGLNYSFFGLFYGMPSLREGLEKKGVKRVTDLFNRMPFLAILFAGATPVPFFPIRFLVVITEYPVWKYLLGVFISRAPRFYLLAWLGKTFDFSGVFLLSVFLGMLLLVNIPAAIKMFGG